MKIYEKDLIIYTLNSTVIFKRNLDDFFKKVSRQRLLKICMSFTKVSWVGPYITIFIYFFDNFFVYYEALSSAITNIANLTTLKNSLDDPKIFLNVPM